MRMRRVGNNDIIDISHTEDISRFRDEILYVHGRFFGLRSDITACREYYVWVCLAVGVLEIKSFKKDDGSSDYSLTEVQSTPDFRYYWRREIDYEGVREDIIMLTVREENAQ